MNYQFDYQMQPPFEWSKDYMVSLADEPAQPSALSSADYRVGFWSDDLRARGRFSAMKRASCRSDVPRRLHSALKCLLSGGVSQSVFGSLYAM